MKKQSLLASSVLAMTFLFITGCKKESDPAPEKTKTELITQSSWKFEKANAGGADVSDNAQLACYTDNIITFSSDLTGTINEGAVICSTPAPANFTWSFENNESILRFSFTLFAGGSPDFTIVSLSEINLVLSQQMTIAPFPPTTVEVTFKH